jgi:hypothetical protein
MATRYVCTRKKFHAEAQRRKVNRFIMYCSAYFAPLREKKNNENITNV